METFLIYEVNNQVLNIFFLVLKMQKRIIHVPLMFSLKFSLLMNLHVFFCNCIQANQARLYRKMKNVEGANEKLWSMMSRKKDGNKKREK